MRVDGDDGGWGACDVKQRVTDTQYKLEIQRLPHCFLCCCLDQRLA